MGTMYVMALNGDDGVNGPSTRAARAPTVSPEPMRIGSEARTQVAPVRRAAQGRAEGQEVQVRWAGRYCFKSKSFCQELTSK